MKTIYELALDNLESNSYELQDEFDNDAIASFVEKLVKKARVSRRGVVDAFLGDYRVRLNANPGGFVSCSNEDGTGVSEHCVCSMANREEMDEYDIGIVLNLLNQAFYLMQTC